MLSANLDFLNCYLYSGPTGARQLLGNQFSDISLEPLVQEMLKIDLIVILAQARAGPQGRSWPLGGAVRAGVVPTWSDLLGAELGHVPPCLDSRSASYVWSCPCSAAASARTAFSQNPWNATIQDVSTQKQHMSLNASACHVYEQWLIPSCGMNGATSMRFPL